VTGPVLRIGEPAADFSLVSTSGNMVLLSSLKGKVVVLAFWASWCGPSTKAIGDLAGAYRQIAAKGAAVIAVASDRDPKAVISYAKSKKLPFPVLLDSTCSVAATRGVTQLPAIFVIDKTGRVRFRNEEFPGLAATLRQIKAAGGPTSVAGANR
jgi:peroxiredoxin